MAFILLLRRVFCRSWHFEDNGLFSDRFMNTRSFQGDSGRFDKAQRIAVPGNFPRMHEAVNVIKLELYSKGRHTSVHRYSYWS